MKTTYEMFEVLQKQMSELIGYLKPNTDDKDKDLHAKLDAILNNQKEKPKIRFDDTKVEVEEYDEYDKLNDRQFENRRNWFALVLAVVTAVLSWVAWLNFLSMFPTIFGFFFTAGGLLFVLAFDEYVLPGNTIKRISKNGIAAAIVILVFAILYVGGVSVGNSLITNRERDEEYSAPTIKTEKYIEPEQPRYDTTNTSKED